MSEAMTRRETKSENSLAIRIALNGNLADLNDGQIWDYYQQMCERLELDPLSRPFDIIEGYEGTGENKRKKKVLYPNSSCSSQLAQKRKITFGPVKVEAEQGLALLGLKVARVSVECSTPDGRKLIGEAFIDLVGQYGPLAGVNLVNALKKAATQARRRGTLQLAGLTLPQDDDNQQISFLGDIEEEPVIEMFPDSTPAGVLGGGDLQQQAAPAEAEASTQVTSVEVKKGDSGRLKGKAAQIEALRASLNWSEENLVKVINEEFTTDHKGALSQLLPELSDTELGTIIQLLKAELQQKQPNR